MATLKDSIGIRAEPAKVFEWFLDIEQNYKAWHPDHVSWRWLKGKPFEGGSVACVEENIHGKLHKLKFLATNVEPNRRIEYKALFPTSIIMPNGSFAIEPRGDGCIFTATLSFRFGWLLRRLAKGEVESIKTHMAAEGENLKRLVERSKKRTAHLRTKHRRLS